MQELIFPVRVNEDNIVYKRLSMYWLLLEGGQTLKLHYSLLGYIMVTLKLSSVRPKPFKIYIIFIYMSRQSVQDVIATSYKMVERHY